MSACCATNCGGRRARSAGKSTWRKRRRPDANHAVKQLLRACLESDEVAEALLPEIMESGAVGGLLGREYLQAIVGSPQRNEKLNLAESEGVLSPQEKRLAFDALFWPGAPPNLEQAQGCLRALKLERLQRERDKLLRDIEAAVQSQDSARLTELQRAKSHLDKELRQLAGHKKIRARTNDLGYITSNFVEP